jgi:Flp pilus assembly protein TadG
VTRRVARLAVRLGRRLSGGSSAGADRGSAIVEFTFLAVLVMVPLVYLIVAIASVQRSSSAVSDAARAAGRALGRADTVAMGEQQARAAVRIAMEDQGLPPDEAQMRVVATSSSCEGPAVAPTLAPGGEYAVCVIRRAQVPGVPTIVAGRGVTTIGRYVVHVDDFRARG